jgi:hypothetical protein
MNFKQKDDELIRKVASDMDKTFQYESIGPFSVRSIKNYQRFAITEALIAMAEEKNKTIRELAELIMHLVNYESMSDLDHADKILRELNLHTDDGPDFAALEYISPSQHKDYREWAKGVSG